MIEWIKTYFYNKKWKDSMIMAAKLSAGCILAILIAYELDVQYSATAGVITVLSIQKYKMETIRTACKRLLAFVAALAVAWAAFGIAGFTTLGFGIFLFLFVFLCMMLEWEIALSICVVLVSHLLEQGTMSWAVLVNEFLVFGIGAGVGIFMNLHLRGDRKALRLRITAVDEQFANILTHMAGRLQKDGTVKDGMEHFERLEEQIYHAEEIAWANHQNSIRQREDRYMNYIMVRKQQCEILYEMEKRIGQLDMTPAQAEHIRVFLEQAAFCYRGKKEETFLIQELKNLFEEMRLEKLPASREEFENRAVLFVFMLHLEELLELHEQKMDI